MSLDEFIKYAIWIIVFLVALSGIYFLTKRLGMI